MRYEGEWKDGMEHGVGTLTEADGSTFYGFWAEGKMHGEGVRNVRSCHVLLLTHMLNAGLHLYLHPM